ncbi:MAG: DUF1211 domain-containing protein [Chitinophaga sp.]|uniref:TMEM175 family protein n=1 Tax=Chitinophaga sp. TaxID=1869181 RepID=UPI0025B90666|nr:TMEM175 family protein [Chitinophaga sp.]MBV8252689.1 DUF1211 domain-containing protein [Chitinophaga sp.]
MNKARIEAFSDGVFAIIITIMVLEIKVPHGAAWSDLCQQYPIFLSYILSFMYVGIYWGNHHHLLHTVKRVTSTIMWANMHLLFWLSLVPFVTGWMGENHFAPHTVATYAIVMILCGTAFSILQIAIKKANPDEGRLGLALAKLRTKAYLSVVGYLIAIALAFVNTVFSGIILLLVAVMWFLPSKAVEEALLEEQND